MTTESLRTQQGPPEDGPSADDRLVLVANDGQTQRLVQTALEPRQVRVVCTADDDQTIAAARGERPDLIVGCLGGSQTEGMAVAQRLKKDAVTAAIPVLAVTRHPSVDLQERAESAGFDALLIEPLTGTTFAEVAGLLIERAALLRQRSDRLRRSDFDVAPRTPQAHRRPVAPVHPPEVVAAFPPASTQCRRCGSQEGSELLRTTASSHIYRCRACHQRWRFTLKR